MLTSIQMSYIPPRGPCSQKTSMLSSCPCYRFMIHPIKAATSFECDGCGHHASFHRMENQQEQEIAQKWKVQEEMRASPARMERNADMGRVEELVEVQVPMKRRRIAAVPELVVDLEAGGVQERKTLPARKRKGKADP